MIIGCTKKVLDFMGVASVEERGDVNPLFSWTANLIIVNRRKTLVVMNDKTKISFVLYGVTTKSIPKMQNLIFDGIRAMMESEYISDEIIENFPGKTFKVEECIPFNKKALKEVASKHPHADITARNFPIDTNTLKKLSKIKDGGSRHIFAVTLTNGEKVLIITQTL